MRYYSFMPQLRLNCKSKCRFRAALTRASLLPAVSHARKRHTDACGKLGGASRGRGKEGKSFPRERLLCWLLILDCVMYCLQHPGFRRDRDEKLYSSYIYGTSNHSQWAQQQAIFQRNRPSDKQKFNDHLQRSTKTYYFESLLQTWRQRE